jgi:hypothetical protein
MSSSDPLELDHISTDLRFRINDLIQSDRKLSALASICHWSIRISRVDDLNELQLISVTVYDYLITFGQRHGQPELEGVSVSELFNLFSESIDVTMTLNSFGDAPKRPMHSHWLFLCRYRELASTHENLTYVNLSIRTLTLISSHRGSKFDYYVIYTGRNPWQPSFAGVLFLRGHDAPSFVIVPER